MTSDIHELHLRICRLEAELTRTAGHVERLRRQWRRTLRGGVIVATVALASITSFTLSAQAPTPYLPTPTEETVVKAPFKVVDKSGKIIMIVGDNNPLRGLDLRDEQGKTRISLTAISTPGLTLSGNNNVGVSLASGIQNGVYVRSLASTDPASGKQIPAHVDAALEVNAIEGGGKLSIADKVGKNILYVADGVSPTDGRITIGTGKVNGDLALRFFSPSNKLLLGMGTTKAGVGTVEAFDANGVARAFFSGKDGKIASMNTSGHYVALMSSEDNEGHVMVINQDQPVVDLTSTHSGSSGKIQLTDAAGGPQVMLGVTPQGEGVACVRKDKRGEVCLGQATLPGMLPGVAK